MSTVAHEIYDYDNVDYQAFWQNFGMPKGPHTTIIAHHKQFVNTF